MPVTTNVHRNKKTTKYLTEIDMAISGSNTFTMIIASLCMYHYHNKPIINFIFS